MVEGLEEGKKRGAARAAWWVWGVEVPGSLGASGFYRRQERAKPRPLLAIRRLEVGRRENAKCSSRSVSAKKQGAALRRDVILLAASLVGGARQQCIVHPPK